MSIKTGEVFAFYVEQRKQYGMIQVLEKSKIGGYNVRVFYHLFDNFDSATINAVVKSNDFYYIKDFYQFDLTRSGKRVGRYMIPETVITPRLTRESDRKQNGALHWYVMDDTGVVETFTEFDNRLIPLSPAAAWGIQYIKQRWIEGFTLANWHELAEKWYEEYLKAYEPHKFLKKEMESIIERWKRTDRVPKEAFELLDVLLSTFTQQICKNKADSYAVEQKIQVLVEGLNAWNSQYHFIETEESEIILEYICDTLETYGCSYDFDLIDAYRQW